MRWKLITYLLLIQSHAREYVWNYINCFASIYWHSTAICPNMFRPVLVFYMNIKKTNRFVNAQAHFWMPSSQELIAQNHFFKFDQEHAFSSLFRFFIHSSMETKIRISPTKRDPGRISRNGLVQSIREGLQNATPSGT